MNLLEKIEHFRMVRAPCLRIPWKRMLPKMIAFLLIAYVGNRYAWLFRHCIGGNLMIRLGVMIMNYQLAFYKVLPSTDRMDLFAGIILALLFYAVLLYRRRNAKQFRHGKEYGSARWGNRKDIQPYIDEDFYNNIIFTKTEFMTMNSRMKLPKYNRNKNVLVIGGSGSGKTRNYVKAQILQMMKGVSFVMTDPKGSVLPETGTMLVRHGYRVTVLNLINFVKSMKYNPLAYIHSEKDILKLVNVIMENTNGKGERATEDFWVKAERLLYCALFGYVYYEAPEAERNINTVIEMIDASETHEDDENFKNAVDILFEELAHENPRHFAVRMYKKYKLAAGKTAKSILVSCGARLAPFAIQELRDLMEYDELHLERLALEKSAFFVIVSDTDPTFHFVAAIMYSQLFDILCEMADDKFFGRLPYHVRFLLDEFANLGKIPNFDRLIATIRSREISANILLQTKSQLKTMYKDAAETIEGNCDTTLFLGGKEQTTLKEITENLGKETIELFNTSDTRGTNRSYGVNYQKIGRDLMPREDLNVMDANKCILQIRGVHPFPSEKYDITKHPNYKELADYDPKLYFDIEKYLKHELKLSMDEEIEGYEYTPKEAAGIYAA